METQNNDELSRLIGFEIGPEFRRQLISEMTTTGEDIRAVCAKRAMPYMAILNDAGLFEYEGEMITPQQWGERNPLGQFGKIIVIRKRKNSETIK